MTVALRGILSSAVIERTRFGGRISAFDPAETDNAGNT